MWKVLRRRFATAPTVHYRGDCELLAVTDKTSPIADVGCADSGDIQVAAQQTPKISPENGPA